MAEQETPAAGPVQRPVGRLVSERDVFDYEYGDPDWIGCGDGGAATSDKEPYCRECGGEDLAYLERTAEAEHYKCRSCGHVIAW